MAHKFPRIMKVTVYQDPVLGYTCKVRLDGELVAAETSNVSREDAREKAWIACEEQGLVQDE